MSARTSMNGLLPSTIVCGNDPAMSQLFRSDSAKELANNENESTRTRKSIPNGDDKTAPRSGFPSGEKSSDSDDSDKSWSRLSMTKEPASPVYEESSGSDQSSSGAGDSEVHFSMPRSKTTPTLNGDIQLDEFLKPLSKYGTESNGDLRLMNGLTRIRAAHEFNMSKLAYLEALFHKAKLEEMRLKGLSSKKVTDDVLSHSSTKIDGIGNMRTSTSGPNLSAVNEIPNGQSLLKAIEYRLQHTKTHDNGRSLYQLGGSFSVGSSLSRLAKGGLQKDNLSRFTSSRERLSCLQPLSIAPAKRQDVLQPRITNAYLGQRSLPRSYRSRSAYSSPAVSPQRSEPPVVSTAAITRRFSSLEPRGRSDQRATIRHLPLRHTTCGFPLESLPLSPPSPAQGAQALQRKMLLFLEIMERQAKFSKDLQSEIETHKDVLASLNATGQKLLGTLDNKEDAVILQRRLEEMNHRWNSLKHKSIAIRNRLEGNAEYWNSLLLSLRELIEWVIRKDTELNSLGPLVGDIACLAKYEDDLDTFRRLLDEKQPVIEANLKNGRQLIASEPALSDTSDSEAGREGDPDSRYRGDDSARDFTRSVRREVAKLSEKWAALRERASSSAAHANAVNKEDAGSCATDEVDSRCMAESPDDVIFDNGIDCAENEGHDAEIASQNKYNTLRPPEDVEVMSDRVNKHFSCVLHSDGSPMLVRGDKCPEVLEERPVLLRLNENNNYCLTSSPTRHTRLRARTGFLGIYPYVREGYHGDPKPLRTFCRSRLAFASPKKEVSLVKERNQVDIEEYQESTKQTIETMRHNFLSSLASIENCDISLRNEKDTSTVESLSSKNVYPSGDFTSVHRDNRFCSDNRCDDNKNFEQSCEDKNFNNYDKISNEEVSSLHNSEIHSNNYVSNVDKTNINFKFTALCCSDNVDTAAVDAAFTVSSPCSAHINEEIKPCDPPPPLYRPDANKLDEIIECDACRTQKFVAHSQKIWQKSVQNASISEPIIGSQRSYVPVFSSQKTLDTAYFDELKCNTGGLSNGAQYCSELTSATWTCYQRSKIEEACKDIASALNGIPCLREEPEGASSTNEKRRMSQYDNLEIIGASFDNASATSSDDYCETDDCGEDCDYCSGEDAEDEDDDVGKCDACAVSKHVSSCKHTKVITNGSLRGVNSRILLPDPGIIHSDLNRNRTFGLRAIHETRIDFSEEDMSYDGSDCDISRSWRFSLCGEAKRRFSLSRQVSTSEEEAGSSGSLPKRPPRLPRPPLGSPGSPRPAMGLQGLQQQRSPGSLRASVGPKMVVPRSPSNPNPPFGFSMYKEGLSPSHSPRVSSRSGGLVTRYFSISDDEECKRSSRRQVSITRNESANRSDASDRGCGESPVDPYWLTWKLGVLHTTLEDVLGRLEEAEKSTAAWGSLPQDPNLIDQHVYTIKPNKVEEGRQTGLWHDWKFREGMPDLQRGVDDVNDQVARFSAHNVPLSVANVGKLQDLNNRWKNLEQLVNDRWRLVAGRSREVTPLTPAQLASSVVPPWERATANNKVPYYINHAEETTHWDHPEMMILLDSLADFNHIKFSAYRTANKLRTLQKKLSLDRAKLQLVTDVFDEHGLRGQNDRLIDVDDMVVVLSTLYGRISADNPDVNAAKATDLCLNWLLNVYDSQRTGQMRVLSFRVGLVCLCRGHLEEKYRYMFRLIADPNRLVDQRKLGLLLHDCLQVPRQLGEVAAFGGSNIEPSVRSCFTKAGKEKESIEAVHFLAWVQQEPQSLVWLAVLHRVAASECVQHQVKCNSCKTYPIVGLRYRCLKCLSFDMCQQCFFEGRSSKSHKITHPMHEYCTATTAGDEMKDFTKALKNKFKSKRSLQKHAKKGYLPVQTVLEGDPLESPSPSPQHVSSQDMHSRLEMYASRLAEVELRTNSNSTPESEDEHGLIAQYCHSLNSMDVPFPVPRSPLQIMESVDADQKDELEQMIKELEKENQALQAEYDMLRSQQPIGSPPDDSVDIQRSEAEMLAEAKLLREHKGRLEARMGILEEHNRQLEEQLMRLRQLLDDQQTVRSPNKSGTLQTKSVTASQLAMDSPAKVNGHSNHGTAIGTYEGLDQLSEYIRPPPPPMGSVGHMENLFSRAGDLEKAVGSLVETIMTDQGNDLPKGTLIASSDVAAIEPEHGEI